jgi:hypothetical protein
MAALTPSRSGHLTSDIAQANYDREVRAASVLSSKDGDATLQRPLDALALRKEVNRRTLKKMPARAIMPHVISLVFWSAFYTTTIAPSRAKEHPTSAQIRSGHESPPPAMCTSSALGTNSS